MLPQCNQRVTLILQYLRELRIDCQGSLVTFNRPVEITQLFPRHAEIVQRLQMARTDGKCLFVIANSSYVVTPCLMGHTAIVVRIRVARIQRNRAVITIYRTSVITRIAAAQPPVVKGLGTLWIGTCGFSEQVACPGTLTVLIGIRSEEQKRIEVVGLNLDRLLETLLSLALLALLMQRQPLLKTPLGSRLVGRR